MTPMLPPSAGSTGILGQQVRRVKLGRALLGGSAVQLGGEFVYGLGGTDRQAQREDFSRTRSADPKAFGRRHQRLKRPVIFRDAERVNDGLPDFRLKTLRFHPFGLPLSVAGSAAPGRNDIQGLGA